MLILDLSGKVIGRKCLLHYANRCTELACLADELDYRTNPNRSRPKATPGAPEVSWGMRGVLHVPPKARPAATKATPSRSSIHLQDPGKIPGGVSGSPKVASSLTRGRPTGLLPAAVFII